MATRIAILIALLLAPVASANEDAPPPVTNDSLNGVWEGIVGDWILYRMDIRPHGDSYLVENFSPQKGFQTLYRLVQRDVRAGHVVLQFRKVSGAIHSATEVTLRGDGFAYDGAGELKTTLIQTVGEKGSCPLRLLKGTKTRILAQMSKQAERLIPR
jgi:hypothetical protein